MKSIVKITIHQRRSTYFGLAVKASLIRPSIRGDQEIDYSGSVNSPCLRASAPEDSGRSLRLAAHTLNRQRMRALPDLNLNELLKRVTMKEARKLTLQAAKEEHL